MGRHRYATGATPYVELISGVKLFRDKGGQVEISFCPEDRHHPDLLRRSRQASARGEAREALDWASLSGKDALLWETFRPLERARVRLASFLQAALAPPATGFDLEPIQALDAARFTYWWSPPVPEANAEATGRRAGGAFEADLRIQVGNSTLILIQTFQEGDWERWTNDVYPDQLVRSLDYGTTESRVRGITDFYLIAVTPCRDSLRPYSTRLRQYRDHPDLLRIALAHRTDLSLADFALLAGRIGWATWGEVAAWSR